MKMLQIHIRAAEIRIRPVMFLVTTVIDVRSELGISGELQ